MIRRALKQRVAAWTAALVVPAMVLGTSALTADSAGTADRDRSAPVVRTDSGLVQGVATARADQFLGLPYAAPPLRELRFAPPATPATWTGVHRADQQSPACVQFEPTGIREEQAVSEDCLYLDVYRPAQVSRNAELPVMVWFHGGGHTQGTGVIYGGSTMAARTGTIVISVNYRLGALGFLAHPALSEVTPGGSGNYGRMDQLASLEWVRDNIARFGGDPENVTVYGQSAGGSAVCDLMAMPSARGLFDRAIVQSSVCTSTRTTLAAGERSGVEFARSVGCTDPATVVTCLRKAWPGKLVANQANYLGSSKVGGALLPKSFKEAFDDGTWNAVPLLTGNTRSENRLTSTALAGITAQGYQDLVRETYGERADRVLELYPLSGFKSPYDAITQVQTDAQRACPNSQMAQTVAAGDRTPVYRYEFNDPTSPTLYGFRIPGEDMSNAHSAELAYLFDFTLGEKPLTARQERLSDQMMRYWGAFAHDGDPNVNGAPSWPRYDATAQKVLQLRTAGASQVITTYAADHHCDFWLG
ncbi:carboxylesterase/lipase family protein [Streptomyces sp. NBC_00038]|uniref:carboxylesterase/lipase family protein n=1 Tax=Streptomyces sp. NBC_00038 TaxID=2903615 RepID=UPI0022507AC8|nr:carboxylesterase family protein [Streptomyces sp. NBC_00038]MCX5561892.1 carboxylesterase family protein [Streptomyces sp. NBC_00038]